MFKYVGVTGIDQPRIVQVGYEMGLFTQLNERIGLEYIIRQLVAGGDINAIWVVNRTMETIAHDSILGGDQRPDTTELRKMAEVYQANEPMSLLSSQNLTVMAPIPVRTASPSASPWYDCPLPISMPRCKSLSPMPSWWVCWWHSSARWSH